MANLGAMAFALAFVAFLGRPLLAPLVGAAMAMVAALGTE